MQVRGIGQGAVSLVLTREDCHQLAQVCDTAADGLLDAEEGVAFQWAELAGALFLACAGALAMHDHLVPEHRAALANDLAALGLE